MENPELLRNLNKTFVEYANADEESVNYTTFPIHFIKSFARPSSKKWKEFATRAQLKRSIWKFSDLENWNSKDAAPKLASVCGLV